MAAASLHSTRIRQAGRALAIEACEAEAEAVSANTAAMNAE
ncbi:unnamed protein product [Ectocarpus sp. 12 AP-2014]